MKRLTISVLTALLVLVGASKLYAEEDKGAVAMSFGGSTIALWNDIIALMEPSLASKGYQLITHDPQFRVEQQVQDWKSWIAQRKVKAIMGWPINADAMIPVTRQAQDAGIPVIGYAVHWRGISAAMLTNPEKDGRSIAEYAVNWVTENIGADAAVEICVLSDEQNDLTALRVKGIYEGVKEGLPNAKVYKVPALSRENGYTAAKQQLTAQSRYDHLALLLERQHEGGLQGADGCGRGSGRSALLPRRHGRDQRRPRPDPASEQHLPDGLCLPQRDARRGERELPWSRRRKASPSRTFSSCRSWSIPRRRRTSTSAT